MAVTTSCNMALLMIIVAASIFMKLATSDPQINLLNKGCSQYNATNIRNFFNNLNATFTDLRSQLSQQNKFFATAQQSRSSDPVYAMVQCRNYLSTADCVACFNAAVAQIRNCSASNGARVIYDGCFLRYESNIFYDQSTLPGNVQICSNRTASQAPQFGTQAQALLKDLQLATPKINGYFAASKRELSTGGNTVYGVAQCAETISKTGCEDCLNVAFNNIDGCLPNADGRAIDAACFLRYSVTSFFPDNQTTNITPFLGGGGKSSKKKAIIGGVVGGAAYIILMLAVFLWYRLHKKPKAAQKGNILGATELRGPVAYDFNVLKTAAKGFSEEDKLGEGGFGEVFKGTLKNGSVVAVKKLNVTSGRARADFESEVRLISNVHHRNLIRLLGCASKGAEVLLVYEYMANGSLDRYLYGDKKGYLNWKQRFDIIFGTARGLAYLHDQYHVSIIHRDIKPSNILLDDDFQPKICDFGLARLMPEDRTHLSTKFAGTLGYTAPEYALHGHLSEKVDTFSFGVVILETVSGRRSSDMTTESSSDYLLEQAWKLYESDMHLKLVDETLNNDYRAEDVKKIIEIALLCTQTQPSDRPTMSEIVVMLSGDRSLEQQRPLRTAVVGSERRFRQVSETTDSASSNSNATASFTEFTGR